ncbi:hypothetical protein ACQ4PT_046520 [Festuca glaucescens]
MVVTALRLDRRDPQLHLSVFVVGRVHGVVACKSTSPKKRQKLQRGLGWAGPIVGVASWRKFRDGSDSLRREERSSEETLTLSIDRREGGGVQIRKARIYLSSGRDETHQLAMAATAALRNVGRAALRQRGTLAQAERRRLFASRPPTIEEKEEARLHLMQIDSKKEELFDLMAGFNGRYRIHGSLAETNGLLLEQLSMAVDPRPHDPQWRWLRGVQRFRRVMTYLGICTFCTTVSVGLPWLIKDPKPKKIARDVWTALQQ